MRKMDFFSLIILGFAVMTACSKTEEPIVSKPATKIGESVTPGNVSGAIKGTMMTGETYILNGIVTIQAGDTLLIQEGVRVHVTQGAALDVKGVFLSLGTKEKPVWITDPNAQKRDTPTQDLDTDPAYKGVWRGIYCFPTCPLCVIKWTHIEFCGTSIPDHPEGKSGSNGLYFANADGYLIFEDSWIYGMTGDGMRIEGGKINVMRNTIEKEGFTGGDGIYPIGSTKGNVAYNLVIGHSTTSSKANGTGATQYRCDIATFNNTALNGGYRRTASGRGGSINYEDHAMGLIYNNMQVNCKYGIRMVKDPSPDLPNIKMGYNYNYGNMESVCEHFYPVGYLTPPQETDIPKPSTFLPAGYQVGDEYDASMLIGQNDPQFVNYPLPIVGLNEDNIKLLAYVGSYDFRLKPTSPAVGAGTDNFEPYFLNDPTFPKGEFGSSEITLPSKDIGAFPLNNKGNQHFPQ